MSPAEIVRTVRNFIRWHAERFNALDSSLEPMADPVGWKRGDEFWIKPDTWRNVIFDGDEVEAVEAARTLRDLGLLRTQDSRNCQAVVCVRDRKSARAYVVKPEIREWRLTAPAYGAYDAAQIGLPYSEDNGSPALIPLGGSPPDLPAKLENVVSLGLDEAERILRLQPDWDHRAYQAILRAKTAVLNGALTNQVRVDEGRLKARETDLLPEILARIDKALAEDEENDR
jgi:hypothetical protein